MFEVIRNALVNLNEFLKPVTVPTLNALRKAISICAAVLVKTIGYVGPLVLIVSAIACLLTGNILGSMFNVFLFFYNASVYAEMRNISFEYMYVTTYRMLGGTDKQVGYSNELFITA